MSKTSAPLGLGLTQNPEQKHTKRAKQLGRAPGGLAGTQQTLVEHCQDCALSKAGCGPVTRGSAHGRPLPATLTLLLDEDPQQRVGCGHGLVVVVVIVDGQQVPVDVGVAHQHVHVGDLVHVLQQAVKLLEAAGLGALQREATELGAELGTGQGGEWRPPAREHSKNAVEHASCRTPAVPSTCHPRTGDCGPMTQLEFPGCPDPP